MNWIKVSTAIARDEKTIAIEDDCEVARAHAVGLVVNVLTMLATERPDGRVSEVRDAVLEGWAMWNGKRGRFAAAFRAAWAADGVVIGWDKWNGAAIREVQRERARKAEARKSAKALPDVRQLSAGHPPDVPQMSAGRPPDVHGKKEKEEERETASTPQRVVDIPSPPPPALLREAAGWVAPFGQDALATLLTHAPDPVVWIGILRGIANGQTMDHNKPCDRERLAVALVDFVAKGKHREDGGPSARLFRSFVKSARAPERKYADQQTAEEHKAELLATIRRSNERLRRMGRPEKPLPPWAAEIDRLFPDGRTFPHDLPGSAA